MFLGDGDIKLSLINDVIKIRLSKAGYLRNYPPHLLSDEEMVEGFYEYFKDVYYTPMYNEFQNPTPVVPYDSDDTDYMVDNLNALFSHIQQTCNAAVEIAKTQGTDFTVSDWIYSYMLGAVVGPKSNVQDIHDVLVLMNIDNLDDVFTRLASETCYTISKYWIAKTNHSDTGNQRPPSVFAELHVIKSLRLANVSMGGVS